MLSLNVLLGMILVIWFTVPVLIEMGYREQARMQSKNRLLAMEKSAMIRKGRHALDLHRYAAQVPFNSDVPI